MWRTWTLVSRSNAAGSVCSSSAHATRPAKRVATFVSVLKTVEKGDVGHLRRYVEVCMVLEIDAVECQVVRIFYTLNHKLVTEVCSLPAPAVGRDSSA